jgi:hypothetical protein
MLEDDEGRVYENPALNGIPVDEEGNAYSTGLTGCFPRQG